MQNAVFEAVIYGCSIGMRLEYSNGLHFSYLQFHSCLLYVDISSDEQTEIIQFFFHEKLSLAKARDECCMSQCASSDQTFLF